MFWDGKKELLSMIKNCLICMIFLIGGWSENVISQTQNYNTSQAINTPAGVCPPYHLRDEQGNVIDPVHNVNANVPYSPKQTCGAPGCHDYAKITEGFHFTQGAGEEPTPNQKARVLWASTPGNFGGNWCSPAPLYRYLSQKRNDAPVAMDMTAYTFIQACGACHPGGGSAEYDRDGKRYDQWIRDSSSGFADGADNNYDGDYYQARWGESGVLEADCLLCHLPGYNYNARSKQISLLNYRWAATAGSGLATVSGALKDGTPIQVTYNASRVKTDGTIDLPLIRSPENQACLNCHQQPDWKKRGANFRARTDVHIRAGLRCVDCHPAGSSSTNQRIKGKEVHQIAKGDDPGGLIRNDLDNTMLTCTDCHDKGRLGAPLASHNGLPPLHIDRIACQTCHIPERAVMPIQFQASDVWNAAPRIPKGGKQLWTFYGPDGLWRNHYGYLEMMGYDNKPTEIFYPILARYKDKIYPVNQIHSAWPGIEIEGKSGLMQPRPSDIYKMWAKHGEDPAKYPSLNEIRDDNADGIPEVNRPEEIDAIITAVSRLLSDIGYPMSGKRVVWVYDDRIYRSGSDYSLINKESWEASPYANVHKYSHDIYPAKAALGAKGCRDCHNPNSHIFQAIVTRYPFDSAGKPILIPQYEALGMSKASVGFGAFRETILRDILQWLFPILIVILLLHYITFGPKDATGKRSEQDGTGFCLLERISHFGLLTTFIALALSGFTTYGTKWLSADAIKSVHNFHHVMGFAFCFFIFLSAILWRRDTRWHPCDWEWLKRLGGYFGFYSEDTTMKFNAGQKVFFWAIIVFSAILLISGIMLIIGALQSWEGVLYTVHIMVAALSMAVLLIHLYLAIFVNPETVPKIFKGTIVRK